MEIVPFTDAHVDAAAELLAEVDFHAQVESEWSADGASGVFSPHGYLIGSPQKKGGATWMWIGIGGHAVAGDAELARDLYAAAAGRWVEDGHREHAVFVPARDRELVDAWFRLSFGLSGVLAMRETEAAQPDDGGVEVRRGTPDDFGQAARLEIAMHEAMQPSPSFSDVPLGTPEEIEQEWREDDYSPYELFVAERDEAVVGHLLLFRRPPDLRVPKDAIDLAQASVEPEARGTGVGRALTAHGIRWAYDNGYPTMVTDWRMTNLWASRFWPRRGFRPAFLRLHRAIP